MNGYTVEVMISIYIILLLILCFFPLKKSKEK